MSHSEQLSLPGFAELIQPFVEQTPDDKSNTFEIYDALVLYSNSHSRLHDGAVLKATKRVKGQVYTVTMTPALVRSATNDRITSSILPGEREELVEKALRKIASESLEHMDISEDENGERAVRVNFTMYQLRKRLSAQGHDFKVSHLQEALEVLQGAMLTIRVEGKGKEAGVKSSIISDVAWSKSINGDEEGRAYKVSARLHPLLTRCIITRTFRQIDYKKLMRTSSTLARWLYVRMSHNYTQAKLGEALSEICRQHGDRHYGYHLSLSTILEENDLEYSRTRDAIRAVRTALASLATQGVLQTDIHGDNFQGWTESIRYQEQAPARGRRPVEDVIFHLFPSVSTINDIIAANETTRQLRPLEA